MGQGGCRYRWHGETGKNVRHRVSLNPFLFEVCIVRGVSGNVVLKAADVP